MGQKYNQKCNNKLRCYKPKNCFSSNKAIINPQINEQINPQSKITEPSKDRRMLKFIKHLNELKDDINSNIQYKIPIYYDDNYACLFSKCLPHDEKGYVDETQMNLLLKALEDKDIELLSKIQLGGKAKLINPTASWNYYSVGDCLDSFKYPNIPKFSSLEMSYYMVELYGMYLCRDIKFSEYSKNTIVSKCCEYLNKFDKSVIGSEKTFLNIFRGNFDFDLKGHYLSQFLLQDMKIGGFIHEQKYKTYIDGSDFLKTREYLISAQNGNVKETMTTDRNKARYLITLRDLACYEHNDEPYQAFTNAIGVLNKIGAPLNSDLVPISTQIPTEKFFVNFGAPNVYDTICQVGRIALSTIWCIKWKTLVARPEAFGLVIDNYFKYNENPCNLSEQLLTNDILTDIYNNNNNYLLPTSYLEGSPPHPSFASGHAVIAGACITAIKFFYNMDFKMDVYIPDVNGENLFKTTDTTTIGEELNKLASNSGFGRNAAGIHYRMDAEFGIDLGQQVAISCLNDLVYTYPYDIKVNIKKFNGDIETIRNF